MFLGRSNTPQPQTSRLYLLRRRHRSSIKHTGRSAHASSQISPVQIAVLAPLSQDQNRIGGLHSRFDRTSQGPAAGAAEGIGLRDRIQLKIPCNLLGFHLGVVDRQLRSLLKQIAADANRRGLAGVNWCRP